MQTRYSIGVEAAAVLEFGPALYLDDAGNAGQTQLARETAGTVEPADLVGHRHATPLDAPVPLVEIVQPLLCRFGVGEQGLDLAPQGRLVGFDGQNIVGPPRPGLLGISRRSG